MKKILFTLLLFTGYLHAQTYPVNPTKFGKISLNTNGVSTSTTKINTQEADGQINYIDAVNLPVPTTVTNALELKTTVSAGAVSGFALTNNGNGTVNIASGIAYLRLTNDPYSSIVKYPISAVTNLALTDNANNFILVDYNAGSPTITVTTNGSIINTQTNSLAYVISRVGNTLDYLNLVGQNIDPNAKLRVRFLNQEGIRRASGAILGFSNRNLTLTSSVLFSGLIRLDAPAFNTLTPDTFTLAYNNGATWTRTTAQTQVNNTQYNVSGVLTTMPNNDYRTDYVYLLPNNPSKLYVIMGATTYNSLTLAKGAPRPSSLPVELQVLGVEVGRLFIQKNSTTIAEVQSSFANEFVGAAVPEHNSLSGLQGGTAGEYNHLNNAQVSLVDGSEQISNKATDFTTANNTLYPSVQAVKGQLDLKANDSDVVKLVGSQTITGDKIFSGSTNLSNTQINGSLSWITGGYPYFFNAPITGGFTRILNLPNFDGSSATLAVTDSPVFTGVPQVPEPTISQSPVTKNYADNLVVGLLNDRGSWDASTNLFPTTGGSGTAGAIKKGNVWSISVAGTLGGVAVGVGDWVRALVDTPAQTAANWAVVEGNFGYVPENVANKSNSYTVSSTTDYPNTKALVDGLATKQNTLINPVTGTGTTNTIPKFTGAGTIGNSNLSDNGATVISSTDMSINGHKIGRGAGNLSDNFVMGNSAFENNTNGNFSVVIGSTAANSYNNNTTANANLLSIGFASSRYNTAGRQFVALGNNAGALSASGSNATNLDNSIFIGFDARPLNTITQQELVIGFQGRGLGPNTSVFGNSLTNFGRWWGNFLVGTSTNNGNIGRFAGTVDVNKLQLNTTPATATGTPPILTWNSTTKDVESVPYATFASVTNLALGTTTTTTQPITNSNGTGFTLPSATTSLAGLQSSTDKTKLDGLVTNATHTGDVTGATALTITNSAVTLAKMANVATGTIFYRKTAGTGTPEVQTLATLKTDLAITKSDVGLSNVDNTSDANKPISTATQTALNGKVSLTGDQSKTGSLKVTTTGDYALSGVASTGDGVVGYSESKSGLAGISNTSLGLYAGTVSGLKIASFNLGIAEKSYISSSSGGLVKVGGTDSQFLKADGSSDSNSYALTTGSNINQSSFRTALGLGSNAYTSTAYISGNGSAKYLPMFTSEGVLGISSLYDSSTVYGEKAISNIAGKYSFLRVEANEGLYNGSSIFGYNSDTGKTLIGSESASPLALITNGVERLTINESTGHAIFSSTVSAPTAPAGTNTTQIATTAFVQNAVSAGGTLPYKVYTALISQTGTNDPSATIMQNTLGGTIIWTRDSAGIYSGTLAGVFTANKTTVSYTNGGIITNLPLVGASRNSGGDISIVTKNPLTGNFEDGYMQTATIEIRVYN